MGTNYYARIIPTKKRKLELCKLINEEDFRTIKNEIDKTFGKFELDWEGNAVGGEVHLGKCSGGWKFLWNPNVYVVKHGHIECTKTSDNSHSTKWIEEPSTLFYLYPLTKNGIKNFIDREGIVIYDEYGEKQDKEYFFNMALEWTTWKGEEAWDSKTYTEWERSKNPNWRIYRYSGEIIDLLKSDGFEMISEDNSDFYSDELRFSTSNDFS